MSVALLGNRNFKLHWASVAVAQVGNFFTTIALPWLVLSVSHDDPVVMTTVLAAGSLPNGFFIIFGGGLADRFSPLKSLFVSRTAFVVVMSTLAALAYISYVPLWLIYIYALVLGTLGAIGIPASQSLLPAFLENSELGKANGIVMGTMQVAQMIGPVAAGWLIWLGRLMNGISDGRTDAKSISFAFAVDAAAMSVAVILMCFMRISVKPAGEGKLLRLIRQGLLFCWKDKGIRLVLGYLVLISFFLQGPLFAVLPLFTKINLGLYERAYGSLYAMIGMGTILGAGIAVATQLSARKLGVVVLCCDLVIGIGFYSLGRVHNPIAAGALLLTMGGGLGLTMVAGTTWFQTRTPGEYMGRVMSLVMFAILGLTPISATIAGYLIAATSVGQVMSGAGLIIIILTAAGLMTPHIRKMGELPVAG